MTELPALKAEDQPMSAQMHFLSSEGNLSDPVAWSAPKGLFPWLLSYLHPPTLAFVLTSRLSYQRPRRRDGLDDNGCLQNIIYSPRAVGSESC